MNFQAEEIKNKWNFLGKKKKKKVKTKKRVE
jgi:hypothetical protein